MITRRQFLKYCVASAAALGLSETDLLKLKEALAVQSNCATPTPPVIYLNGQGCSGCITSLLNRIIWVTGGYYDADILNALGIAAPQGTPNDPIPELNVVNDIADLLVGDAVGTLTGVPRNLTWGPLPAGYVTNTWNTTIMAAVGNTLNGNPVPYDAVDELNRIVSAGGFVLMVEGTTPLKKGGTFCWVFDDPHNYSGFGPGRITMRDALRWIAPQAAFIINVGTCSCFGGIPAAKGSRTKAKKTKKILNKYGISTPFINIPGCPPHPDWIVSPVAYFLINGVLPPVDGYKRPIDIYPPGINLCMQCSKYDSYNPATAANYPGDGGCTFWIGCNGKYTRADCPTRGWGNFDDGTKNNWCVGYQQGHPMAYGIADAQAVCVGCVVPDFPDGRSPFWSVIKGF